mmetsp:Transcript_24687/g.67260  ORF Transcript_24687/g.67260 Transcript_24687/m.67260 type:complete len:936 (+) Transcript_24687:138-2945(+)
MSGHMDDGDELEQVPLQRAKSSSIQATERLLAAKGLNAEQSQGRILSPHHHYYKKWCLVVAGMALLLAIIDPLHLAFATADGLYPYDDFWAVMVYIMMIIFGADMALKFFIAYDDPERGMVYEPKLIAMNYFRFWFWVDLATTLPLESIAVAGVGGNQGYNDRQCLFLGLIRWINLVRLYRIFGAFEYLNRKMMIGQVALTLLRTTIVLFYVAHWMACVFYFIARAQGFTSDTWAGAVETMVDADPWGRYFLSLYFSFVILTGFGDNTFYDRTALETCFVIGYLLASVVLNSYILGSITTVMVSDDERSNILRERVESLNAFSEQKELPESLVELMRDHLELLHHTESTSDELILHRYPPTLRKKVLRHLYLDIFRKCPPFKGCKTRFLDEVISMARMEIFNPEMEVLVEGEVVQELFVIVEGVVYGARSASSASQERKAAKLRSKSSKSARFGSMAMSGSMNPSHSFTSQREDSVQSANGSVSMKGGLSMKGGQGGFSPSMKGVSFKDGDGGASTRSSKSSASFSPGTGTFSSTEGVVWSDSKVVTYTSGQCFGHYSFFTDGPCLQDYWTGSLARIMILSKAQINELAIRHPKQVKLVLFNLRQQVDEKFRPAVADALAKQAKSLDTDLTGFLGSQSFTPPDGAVEIAPLSKEETEVLQTALAGRQSFSLPAVQRPLNRLKGLMPVDERCNIQYWQEAREMTLEYLRSQEQQNVYEIIAAAAEADIAKVKKLVALGVPPGSMDYDRRTALMVAAHENNAAVVRYLLEAGAPPNEQDAFGITAMYEAVRMGNSEVIDVLQRYDAKLGMDEDMTAGILTEAVIAGDLQQLRALLKIGVEATWGDFDGRTPLHFAARESNIAAVEVLVEEGNACVDALDRFNRTPADFARKAGNGATAEYLEGLQREGKRASWTETKWYLQWQRARSRSQLASQGAH